MIFNKQVNIEEYKKFILDFESEKRHIIDLIKIKIATLVQETVTKKFY